MSRRILKMISEGEGLRLDFKYCISDSRKISRTLSAFSNTEGGTLLIGVRDNGAIAGVRDDEEVFMIETASKVFCKPEISLTIKQHYIEQKCVLEVVVGKGDNKPYKAKGADGLWRSYIRQADQNIEANQVLRRVWRKEKFSKGVCIRFSEAENILLEYLRSNGSITISGYRRLAGINNVRAQNILANMILCNIITLHLNEKGAYYTLTPSD